MKRKILVVTYVITFFMIFFWAKRNIVVSAGATETVAQDKEKVVTAVYIEQDSSLWKYAEQYYSPEYGDIEHMITEIKRTNGIHDDTIRRGSYILIPYYVEK